MNIINARIEDKDRIIDLYKDAIEKIKDSPFTPYWEFGVHPTEESLTEAIEKKELFVLWEEKPLAAMVLTPLDDNTLELHLLVVSPDCQRKGIGKIMIEKAIDIAAKRSFTKIILDVIKTNLPARHLYENMGFVFVKDNSNYFPDGSKLELLLYELVL